jgi:multidrug efflux pump subunit AcrA (membrane-fusion protein)
VGGGLFSRGRIIPIALGVLALLLVFLIVHDILVPASPSAAAVSTDTVLRGSVMSAVTGTGTVMPATQQNVNFGVSGVVAEVDVKAGDRVTAGQTLAKLDPTTLQQSLTQAQNGLTQAQSSLSSTVNGNAVTVAQHQLANAQQSLSDTEAQVNLTNQQDTAQLTPDQAQLTTDTNNLSPSSAIETALASCLAAQQTNPKQDCTPAQQAVNQAQAAFNQDQNKVNQDQNKIAQDKLSGQRSIDQANNAVQSAQDSLNSQTTQRPNTIASQQASVSNAQISVDNAQRNLNFTILTAPFTGTVLSVSGNVGDSVSGGGSSSASSASSSSGGTGGGGAGGNGGTGGTGGSSTSSSGTGFIVLGDLTGFQVVTPFAESDAARVQANQTATVTFDAITGLSLTAHVTTVAQTATVTSNVTNYSVTLVLDQIDQRLKSGMTANANVIVQQAQNVLTLPNSAITHIGNAAFVTLLGKDGKTQTRTPVQTGAVGDSSTEIISGLNLGDRVVRPTLRTGTTGTGANGLGAGLGGGGGGGFRGGAGGGGGGVRIGG